MKSDANSSSNPSWTCENCATEWNAPLPDPDAKSRIDRRRNCPACDASHEWSAFPSIEEQHGENPAQWLAGCRKKKTTRTVASLIRGMADLDRVNAWLHVEQEFFGGRGGRGHRTHGPVTYLLARRAVLRKDIGDLDESLFHLVTSRREQDRLGHLVDVNAVPVETTSSDSDTDEEAAEEQSDENNTVETPEATSPESPADEGDTPVAADGGHDRTGTQNEMDNAEYVAALDEARSIVTSFSTVAEVERHLERESSRAHAREHVIEALEDRRDELQGDGDEQEVAA